MNLTIHNAYIYNNGIIKNNKIDKLICRSENGYYLSDIDNNKHNNKNKYRIETSTYLGNECTIINTNIGIVGKLVGDYIYIFDILSRTDTTFNSINPIITLDEAEIIYNNVNINSESVYLIDLRCDINDNLLYTEKRNCILIGSNVYYASPIPVYDIEVDNMNPGFYYESVTNFNSKIKTFRFPKKDYYIIHILTGSFLSNINSKDNTCIITFNTDTFDDTEYIEINLNEILSKETTLIEVI